MRHMMSMVAGPVEQIADCVLAHRAVGVAVVREQQGAVSGERPQGPKDGHALRREWHEMIAANLLFAVKIALHPRGGNPPEWVIAIKVLKLCPPGTADLIRPYSSQRKQAER